MISLDNKEYPEKVINVLKVLDSYDCDYQVRTFEEPAHHAKQAAALLNCPLGAVVKSLVFGIEGQEKYLLILVSGQNKVYRRKLAKIIGKQVYPAKPEKVLSVTGYPVGAVPPFGLRADLPVIIDEDLMNFQNLWASAGSVNALVKFQSSIMDQITNGKVYDIKKF